MKQRRNICNHIKCNVKTYLGMISDIETSFTETWDDLDFDFDIWGFPKPLLPELDELNSLRSGISGSMVLCMKKAGSNGKGSVREKLLSIRTTEAMVGLSITFSWTHNNPMCILLMTSRNEPDPVFNVASIISATVPFRQLFHA